MKKFKKIYFVLLLIIVFMLSAMYFSYAFFTSKNEEHGKLNIVVGTLEYKIESSDLQDNSITVSSGDTKIITLSVKSLNDVASKYELYYKLENDNDLVTVGFLEDSLNTKSGTLENYESKKIEVIIRNQSDSNQQITFGVKGGLINNSLVLSDDQKSLTDYCSKEDVYTFDYTGGEQEFVILCDGTYQLETWGAQGGSGIFDSINLSGGYGSYSTGQTQLNKNDKLYINVGGKGKELQYTVANLANTYTNGNGYNGGGDANGRVGEYGVSGGGGGGATHIATQSGLLSLLNSYQGNILIVSGGGGGGMTYGPGAYPNWSGYGGHAGGISGNNGSNLNDYYYCQSYGATQTSGGASIYNSAVISNQNICSPYVGSFGKGGMYPNTTIQNDGYSSGGGSGYYGGAGGVHGAGAGGSSYIGNSLLTNKVMYCYECEESIEESTKTVSTINVSEIPISNYAKIGNGYAKITYLGR